MRALVQRVTEASARVDGAVIGRIGPGLPILTCAMQGDEDSAAAPLARKIAVLRIFRDAAGKMNRALADTGGAALVVGQFTLAAETTRGNRPGFSAAADPATGARLYTAFTRALAHAVMPAHLHLRARAASASPVAIALSP